MDISVILHVATVTFCVALSAFGSALGGSRASAAAMNALQKAPGSSESIIRATILGMALTETAGILTVLIALILLFSTTPPAATAYLQYIAQLGIAFALGISGFLIGILSAVPAQQTFLALTRQPFMSTQLINMMLLAQSILQTPVIFAFLISLLIRAQLSSLTELSMSLKLVASGLCLGLGTIGPAYGLARFSIATITGIAHNPRAYSVLVPFTFLSQAIIETPILFAFLISILIITIPISAYDTLAYSIRFFAAACAMGLGTFGPGFASGMMSSQACTQIARTPAQASALSRTSVFGQGLIDAAAIYALLISLLLILLR